MRWPGWTGRRRQVPAERMRVTTADLHHLGRPGASESGNLNTRLEQAQVRQQQLDGALAQRLECRVERLARCQCHPDCWQATADLSHPALAETAHSHIDARQWGSRLDRELDL